MIDNTINDYYTQFNIRQYLIDFANTENFWDNLTDIYGTQFDRATAEKIRDQWQQVDFSSLPAIEILTIL
jgi:hypothetical protein